MCWTSRDDLPPGELCWRMTSRGGAEENIRYAHPTSPGRPRLTSRRTDDPDRMVAPGQKTAAARIRATSRQSPPPRQPGTRAAELRSPAPGQAADLTPPGHQTPWTTRSRDGPGAGRPGARRAAAGRIRPGSRSAHSPRTMVRSGRRGPEDHHCHPRWPEATPKPPWHAPWTATTPGRRRGIRDDREASPSPATDICHG